MTRDVQPHEKEAAVLAGKAGGEYLESINKFNLSQLTKEEWETFVTCICMEFWDKTIPF